MFRFREALGKEVGSIIVSGDVEEINLARCDAFPDEVVLDADVLRPCR
jgi:hypothetical protein